MISFSTEHGVQREEKQIATNKSDKWLWHMGWVVDLEQRTWYDFTNEKRDNMYIMVSQYYCNFERE